MEPGKKEEDIMFNMAHPIPRSFSKKLRRVHDLLKQKLSRSPKVGYECFQGTLFQVAIHCFKLEYLSSQ
jgi:hypothetical protein